MMLNDCFYYGVFSPDGYYSIANKPAFCDNNGFTVRGNSHAVKQELFGYIGAELEKRNMNYTLFSTADGCEGIYTQDGKFRITDGIGHPDDEIISLEDFQDGEYISEHGEQISLYIEKREKAAERCCRFLSAAQSVGNDAARLDADNIDIAKVSRFTSRLWQKSGGKLNGRVGTETKRFVSCPTPEGVELNMEAFDIYCEKMIVIVDKTGACAHMIVDRLRRYALGAGYDVISCLCPMNIENGAEHLIIPELKLGVFVSKYYHRADFENSRRIFVKRFFKSTGEQTKNRIDFSLKACRKLMDEAFYSLEKVAEYDKKLDCLYFAATDIDKLNSYVTKNLF